MEIDYTVGDEIVCIQTHSQGFVKSGQIKVANTITTNKCCGAIVVDVGVKGSVSKPSICWNCGVLNYYGKIVFLKASLFRSLQKIDISEALEVLEKQPFEI